MGLGLVALALIVLIWFVATANRFVKLKPKSRFMQITSYSAAWKTFSMAGLANNSPRMAMLSNASGSTR